MNVAQFFKEIVEKYNEQQKCGFCWNFKHVKGESGMNTIRLTEDNKCCVQLILTYQQKSHSERFNFTTTGTTETYCDNIFTIYAVRTANLGTNFGNEIPNHDYTESISSEIIEPLFDCLTCDNIIDLCDFNVVSGITQWRAEEVLFLGDHNFSGIKINGAFRTKMD